MSPRSLRPSPHSFPCSAAKAHKARSAALSPLTQSRSLREQLYTSLVLVRFPHSSPFCLFHSQAADGASADDVAEEEGEQDEEDNEKKADDNDEQEEDEDDDEESRYEDQASHRICAAWLYVSFPYLLVF